MSIAPCVSDAVLLHAHHGTQKLILRNEYNAHPIVIAMEDTECIMTAALKTQRLTDLEFTGCIMKDGAVVSAIASFLNGIDKCPSVCSLRLSASPVAGPCRMSNLECIERAPSNHLTTLILSNLHFSCDRTTFLFRNSTRRCKNLKRLELHDSFFSDDTTSGLREVLGSLTEDDGCLERFEICRSEGCLGLSEITEVLSKKSSGITHFLSKEFLLYMPPNYKWELTELVRRALKTNNTVLREVGWELSFFDVEIRTLLHRNCMIAASNRIITGRSNPAVTARALIRFCQVHPSVGASAFFLMMREMVGGEGGAFHRRKRRNYI